MLLFRSVIRRIKGIKYFEYNTNFIGRKIFLAAR